MVNSNAFQTIKTTGFQNKRFKGIDMKVALFSRHGEED